MYRDDDNQDPIPMDSLAWKWQSIGVIRQWNHIIKYTATDQGSLDIRAVWYILK